VKSKWSTFVETITTLLVFGAPVIAMVIIAFIAYQISVSDLPDWFKFWLLN
jgi:hypothetical protein